MSLTSAAVVAGIALLAPLALALTGVRLPDNALEILLGVVVGPQVFGWATVDQPVAVLALIGLALLLLLAGLEIDFPRLKGRVLRLTATAFALSFVLALGAGGLLNQAGLIRSPLLIAVILSATSLGIILPVLEDAGQASTTFDGPSFNVLRELTTSGMTVTVKRSFCRSTGRPNRLAT